MAEACPQCAAIVDDTNVAPGQLLRCDKCGTRFAKPKQNRLGAVDAKTWSVRDEDRELGIHPALARRYKGLNSLPDGAPVEDSPAAPAPPQAAPPQPAPPQPAPPPAPPPLMPRPLEVPVDTRVLQPPVGEVLESTNPGRPVKSPARPSAGKPPPPADVQPRIPGYECTELVGKGAMGRVYRARHLKSGRAAAVKILAPELAARQDFIQRFEREGAAMRAVEHPGVVAVLDQGASLQPDGSEAHYIAMDFIEGQPLRRHLELAGRGQALEPLRALRFARKIVQALGAAHARGVIHRDLKPENILVLGPDGDERLVLVDFGLAGILDEENDPHPNLTKSRMTMGTVNYMAPEQRTDAKRVDQRADLYAAGVIFYELITGDLPLGRFALPTERGAPVPLSVDKCIVRALARNPDERYQHAGQLDADLAAIENEVRGQGARDTQIGRARGTDIDGRRSSVPEHAISTGGVLVAGVGSTAALMDTPTWIRRSTFMWAAGALLIGTLLGLLMLRSSCAM
jgi:Protein kinase domain